MIDWIHRENNFIISPVHFEHLPEDSALPWTELKQKPNSIAAADIRDG